MIPWAQGEVETPTVLDKDGRWSGSTVSSQSETCMCGLTLQICEMQYCDFQTTEVYCHKHYWGLVDLASALHSPDFGKFCQSLELWKNDLL
jgi:hypothetical protein